MSRHWSVARPTFSLVLGRCNIYDRRGKKMSEKKVGKETNRRSVSYVWKGGSFIILRTFPLLHSRTYFNQKSDQFCDCNYDLYMYIQLHCILSLTRVYWILFCFLLCYKDVQETPGYTDTWVKEFKSNYCCLNFHISICQELWIGLHSCLNARTHSGGVSLLEVGQDVIFLQRSGKRE